MRNSVVGGVKDVSSHARKTMRVQREEVTEVMESLRKGDVVQAEDLARALLLKMPPVTKEALDEVLEELRAGTSRLYIDGREPAVIRQRYQMEVLCQGLSLVSTHSAQSFQRSVWRHSPHTMGGMRPTGVKTAAEVASYALRGSTVLWRLLQDVVGLKLEVSRQNKSDARFPGLQVLLEAVTVIGEINEAGRKISFGLPHGSAFCVPGREAHQNTLWAWRMPEAISLTQPATTPLEELLGDRLGGQGFTWLTGQVLQMQGDARLAAEGRWLRRPRYPRDSMLLLVMRGKRKGPRGRKAGEEEEEGPPSVVMLVPAMEWRATAAINRDVQAMLGDSCACPAEAGSEQARGGPWAAFKLALPFMCWGRDCRFGEGTLQALSDLVRACYSAHKFIEDEASVVIVKDVRHGSHRGGRPSRPAHLEAWKRAGDQAIEALEHLFGASGPLAGMIRGSLLQADPKTWSRQVTDRSQASTTDFFEEDENEDDDDDMEEQDEAPELLDSVDLGAFAEALNSAELDVSCVCHMVGGGKDETPKEDLLQALQDLRRAVANVKATKLYRKRPWQPPLGSGAVHGSLDGGRVLVGGLGQVWLAGFGATSCRPKGNPFHDMMYLATTLLLEDCMMPISVADLSVLAQDIGADSATVATWLRTDEDTALAVLETGEALIVDAQRERAVRIRAGSKAGSIRFGSIARNSLLETVRTSFTRHNRSRDSIARSDRTSFSKGDATPSPRRSARRSEDLLESSDSAADIVAEASSEADSPSPASRGAPESPAAPPGKGGGRRGTVLRGDAESPAALAALLRRGGGEPSRAGPGLPTAVAEVMPPTPSSPSGGRRSHAREGASWRFSDDGEEAMPPTPSSPTGGRRSHARQGAPRRSSGDGEEAMPPTPSSPTGGRRSHARQGGSFRSSGGGDEGMWSFNMASRTGTFTVPEQSDEDDDDEDHRVAKADDATGKPRKGQESEMGPSSSRGSPRRKVPASPARDSQSERQSRGALRTTDDRTLEEAFANALKETEDSMAWSPAKSGGVVGRQAPLLRESPRGSGQHSESNTAGELHSGPHGRTGPPGPPPRRFSAAVRPGGVPRISVADAPPIPRASVGPQQVTPGSLTSPTRRSVAPRRTVTEEVEGDAVFEGQIPLGLSVVGSRDQAKLQHKRAEVVSKALVDRLPMAMWLHAGDERAAVALSAEAPQPVAVESLPPSPKAASIPLKGNAAAEARAAAAAAAAQAALPWPRAPPPGLRGSLKFAWQLQDAALVAAAQWQFGCPQDPLLPGSDENECEAAAAAAGLLPQLAAVADILLAGGATTELAPWQCYWVLKHGTLVCRRLQWILEELLDAQRNGETRSRRRGDAPLAKVSLAGMDGHRNSFSTMLDDPLRLSVADKPAAPPVALPQPAKGTSGAEALAAAAAAARAIVASGTAAKQPVHDHAAVTTKFEALPPAAVISGISFAEGHRLLVAGRPPAPGARQGRVGGTAAAGGAATGATGTLAALGPRRTSAGLESPRSHGAAGSGMSTPSNSGKPAAAGLFPASPAGPPAEPELQGSDGFFIFIGATTGGCLDAEVLGEQNNKERMAGTRIGSRMTKMAGSRRGSSNWRGGRESSAHMGGFAFAAAAASKKNNVGRASNFGRGSQSGPTTPYHGSTRGGSMFLSTTSVMRIGGIAVSEEHMGGQTLDSALANVFALPMVGWPCAVPGSGPIRATRLLPEDLVPAPSQIATASVVLPVPMKASPNGSKVLSSRNSSEFASAEQSVEEVEDADEEANDLLLQHSVEEGPTSADLRKRAWEQVSELFAKSPYEHSGAVLDLSAVFCQEEHVETVRNVAWSQAEEFPFKVAGGQGRGKAALLMDCKEYLVDGPEILREWCADGNDFLKGIKHGWSYFSTASDFTLRGNGGQEAASQLARLVEFMEGGTEVVHPGTFIYTTYRVQVSTHPLFATGAIQEDGKPPVHLVTFAEMSLREERPEFEAPSVSHIMDRRMTKKVSSNQLSPAQRHVMAAPAYTAHVHLHLTFRASQEVVLLPKGARIRILPTQVNLPAELTRSSEDEIVAASVSVEEGGSKEEASQMQSQQETGESEELVQASASVHSSRTVGTTSHRATMELAVHQAGVGGHGATIEALREDGRYVVYLDGVEGQEFPFDPCRGNYEPAGVYRYAVGQRLMVYVKREGDAAWIDGVVKGVLGCRHELEVAPVKGSRELPMCSVTLSEANHAPARLSATAFEKLARRHRRAVRAKFGFMVEPLSGRSLDVLTQGFAVGLRGSPVDSDGWDLLLRTVQPPRGRVNGGLEGRGVLVWGEAGSGKTCLARRLAVECVQIADGLLPLLVEAIDLADYVVVDGAGKALEQEHPDPLDALLRDRHGGEEDGLGAEPYLFASQAIYSRQVVIIVDGGDAVRGTAWPALQAYLCRLADIGHRVVLFARPEVEAAAAAAEALLAEEGSPEQQQPAAQPQQQADGARRLSLNAARRASTGSRRGSVLVQPARSALAEPTPLVEMEVRPFSRNLQKAVAEARLGTEMAEEFMINFQSCDSITEHPFGLCVLLTVAEKEGMGGKRKAATEALALAAGAVLQSTLRLKPADQEESIAILEIIALEIQRFGTNGCITLKGVKEALEYEQPSLVSLWKRLRDKIGDGETVLLQPGAPTAENKHTIRFINNAFKDYFLARCYVNYVSRGADPGLRPLEEVLFDPEWDSFFSYMLELMEQSSRRVDLDFSTVSMTSAQVHELINRFKPWTKPLLHLVLGRDQVCELPLLSEMCTQIGRTLIFLSVHQNTLGGPGAAVLSKWLCGSGAHVRHLDLSHCMLGSEGAEHLGKALMENKSVELLDLSSNALGIEGAGFIAQALECNQALGRLEMCFNSLRGAGACALLEGLRNNGTLKVLSMSRNHIGEDGAKMLAEAMSVGAGGRLQEIGLEANEFGALGVQRFVRGLLGDSLSLTCLRLEGNEVGEEGAWHLAEALLADAGGPLQELCLEHGQIGPVGVRHLARALSQGSSLVRLELRGNRLGAEGARQLAKCLSAHECTLQRLGLRGNALCDEGAIIIGAALKRPDSSVGGLEELDLSDNRIGPAGARAIAEALASESVFLTKLDLGRNRVGPDGAVALACTFCTPTTLEELIMPGNGIETRGALAIADALMNGPQKITILDLQDNHIGEKGMRFLARASGRAPSLRTLCAKGNSAGADWERHLANLCQASKSSGGSESGGSPRRMSAIAAQKQQAAAADITAMMVQRWAKLYTGLRIQAAQAASVKDSMKMSRTASFGFGPQTGR